MRKVLIGVAILALAAAGCGQTSGGAKASAGSSGPSIAFFAPLLKNSFTEAVVEGAKEEAAKEGVHLTVFDANNDVNTQVSQIKSAVASQKFTGLAVHPVNSASVTPTLKDVIAGGMTVGCVYQACGPNPNGTSIQTAGLAVQVGVDFVAQGDMLGQAIEAACAQLTDCKVAYIPGLLTTANDAYRRQGMQARLHNDPNIKIVSQDQAGQSRVDTARQVAIDILQAHPDVNVIAAAGDQMALGVEKAAAEKGNSKVKIVGLGGSKVGTDAIRAGRWFASSAPLFPRSDGAAVIQKLVAMLHHTEKPGVVVLDSSFGQNLPFVDAASAGRFSPQWNGS